MRHYILLGAPGSGKGTQSQLLVEKRGMKHLSTGELLRQEIVQQTPLGLSVQEIIKEGRLVSDAIVIQMIAKQIKAEGMNRGFLFDGFPRTKVQAAALDHLLAQHHTAVHSVIHLSVCNEELLRRLKKRAVLSGRNDDNELTIQARLSAYQAIMQEIMNYYAPKIPVHTIEGEGAVAAVYEKIVQIL